MIPRAAAIKLRRGWRSVDVPETAPSNVRELPTLDRLKFNSEKYCRMVDALPPELRAMVHAHDWQTVSSRYPQAVQAAWWKAAENNWGRG